MGSSIPPDVQRPQVRRDPSRKSPEHLPKSPPAVRIGGAEVDLPRGLVRAPDGTLTELRRQSADVLSMLVARRGETLGKEELHAAIWGGIAVTDDSLVQCVGDIRRALGTARDALKTVPKLGYCLEEDSSPAHAQPDGRSRWRGLRLPMLASAALAALLLAGLFPWWSGAFRSDAKPLAKGPLVAVLPFANGGGGERWDRLASGVTDEIIADLGRNDWIAVFARAASEKQAGTSPQEVHAALGADYVVTGTVQAEGERVRVSAALADALSGRQVWAESWQGRTDDLLALQVSAAEALVGELAGGYTGAIARAGRSRAHAKTASLAAYDLYLIGIEHKHRFTEQDLHLADGYLLQAATLDPGFAKAWVGLSIVQGFLGPYAKSDAEVALIRQKQRRYIERAVAADPDEPTVLIEASRLDAIDGDPEAAARKLRRAVERAPNDADVLAVAAWSAFERAPIGAEAVGWADRALALNPERPDWYLEARGEATFASGDDAGAVRWLSEGPKDLPDRLLYLAAATGNLGDRRAAEAAAAELRRHVPDFDLKAYLRDWPWEQGLREKLRTGAIRAGLGSSRPDKQD
ncbi:MAG: winged helix-turn-helix domain-containing protein [Geminicoccaceae bacterium]